MKQCLIACVAMAMLVVGCQQTKEMGKSAKGLFLGATGTTIERAPEQISAAIDATAAELKYFRIGATTKAVEQKTETTVVLRNSADEKISISYRPVTEKQTHVEVSTGAFGDSDLRQAVWETLKSKLGLLGTTRGPSN